MVLGSANTVSGAQRPLSLGFVGGGLSSAVGQAHFSASQLDGRWRLECGVFSRNREVNRHTGRAWHIAAERVHDSLEALIEAETGRLDAVAVLTPTPDHPDTVCALLERGIPVICEKTLADSTAGIDRVRTACVGRGAFLAVTYNYSGYPMVRELREMIHSGRLGDINQIHVEMPQEGFVRPPPIAGHDVPTPQRWRLAEGEVPMVCLDLGAHLYHLVVFLTGQEPTEVMANFKNYAPYHGIVDTSLMWMNFASGMTGSFWFTKTAIGNRNGLRVRVYGDRGSAEWYQMEPESLQFATIDGLRTTLDRGGNVTVAKALRYNRFKAGHPSGFVEAFANLYVDIAEALTEFRHSGHHTNPYVYGLDHSERGLRLFASARASDRERSWQPL
ncbi:MAG: Gfo/Idh/MocA family oxidoreductase [Magnetococcus sp. MYC-9]